MGDGLDDVDGQCLGRGWMGSVWGGAGWGWMDNVWGGAGWTVFRVGLDAGWGGAGLTVFGEGLNGHC